MTKERNIAIGASGVAIFLCAGCLGLTLLVSHDAQVQGDLEGTISSLKETIEPSTQTPIALKDRGSSYEIMLPETLMSVNKDGVAVIKDMGMFRTYLQLAIAGKGDVAASKRASLIGEMLSTDGISQSLVPNFWLDEKKGRDMVADDALHIFSIDEVKQKVADGQRSDLLSVRNVEGGREVHAGIVGSASQVESIAIRLVTENQLLNAGKQSASNENILAYLSQPGVEKTIRETASGLLNRNDYKVSAKNLPRPVDVARGIFAEEQSAFTVCITEGDNALTRVGQRETTNTDTFSKNLEKKTTKNDETTQKGDLRSQLLVILTVDANGAPVLDVIELKNTPDDRNASRANTPNDKEKVDVSVNGYRWIPCGGGAELAVTPTGTVIVRTPNGEITEVPPTATKVYLPSKTPTPILTVPATNVPPVTPTSNPPAARPTDKDYSTVVPTPKSGEPTKGPVMPTPNPVVEPTGAIS